MSINIGPPAVEELRPRITVIGVGGAGGNAIANMIEAEIEGVDFIVANTDAQALNSSLSEHRIQLGPDITQGLGAGSRPEVGRAAAEETVADIERALEGVNMVFIAAGMGGGTGTGAAPVIAEAARRMGVLTVGVVTKPFLFEGTRRMRAADSGIEELQKHVDTLIVIPNQNLFLVAKADTTFKEAFQLADEVLQQGVRSITDLMVMPGLINLDFADVRSVMGEMGKAMMGTGEGEGENRALEAAERAIANPLLDGVSMQGARGVIISIIGGEDMRLLEVDEAANHIRELVDPDANIIWGSAFNPDLKGRIRVSVVATGIDHTESTSAAPMDASRTAANLAASRAPKRPALPLPAGIDDDDDAAADDAGSDDALELAEVAAPDPVAASPAPIPTGFGAEDEDDEFDEDDEDETANASYGSMLSPEPVGSAEDEEEEGEPFELTSEAGDDTGTRDEDNAPTGRSGFGRDSLFSDADRLAEEDAPMSPGFGGRRRALVPDRGGDTAEPEAPASPARRGGVAGATLFERMANLSRGSGSGDADAEDEDDDDDNSPSLSIPRFLGRQNNQ